MDRDIWCQANSPIIYGTQSKPQSIVMTTKGEAIAQFKMLVLRITYYCIYCAMNPCLLCVPENIKVMQH